MINRQKKIRGFTLTEFGVVLGVFGVIVAGIWEVSKIANENARVSEAQQLLTEIVENTREYYGNSVNAAGNVGIPNVTGGDLIPALVAARILPTQYVNAGACAATPWGDTNAIRSPWNMGVCNEVRVCAGVAYYPCYTSADASTYNSQIFTVTFLKKDTASCINFVTSIGPLNMNGLVDVNFGVSTNQTQKGVLKSGFQTSLPLTPSNARALCTSTTPKYDSFAFVFRLHPQVTN